VSPPDSRRDWHGEFPPPDPKYLRAVELWAECHLTCDAYDGTAGPPPPERRADSNRFAAEVRRATFERAIREGISDEATEATKEEGLKEAERRQRASGFDSEWFAYVDARRAGMMR